jgi:hypothetical protein
MWHQAEVGDLDRPVLMALELEVPAGGASLIKNPRADRSLEIFLDLAVAPD